MGDKIITRRGLKADLPVLDTGEVGYSTDTKQLYVGNNGENDLLFSSINYIYEVGPELEYTTIQTAIDAAIADGHTSNSNPALVKVHYKNGGYTENVTLKAGVHLEGVGRSQAFSITGIHSYAPTSGNRSANTISVRSLTFVSTGGAPAFTLGGTAPAEVRFLGSSIEVNGLNDGFEALKVTSSSNDVRIKLFGVASIYFNDTTPGTYAVDLNRGQFRMLDASNVGSDLENILFKLNNSARVVVRSNTPDGDALYSAGDYLFELNSASCQVNLHGNKVSSFGLGGVFKYNAAAFVNATNCYFDCSDNGGKLAEGAAGSLNLGNCTFNNPGNGVCDVDPGINVGLHADRLRFEQKGGRLVAHVGSAGFPDIASAITFVEAAGGGDVLIAAGNYTENLALSGQVNLVGDTEEYAVNSINKVIIEGNHTVNLTGVLKLSNINFQGPGGPVFDVQSGSFDFILQNCNIVKVDDVTSPSILVSSTDQMQLYAKNCSFNRTGSSDTKIIDMSAAHANSYTYVENSNFAVSSIDNGTTLILDQAANQSAQFVSCYIRGGETNTAFRLQNSSSIHLTRTNVEVNAINGQVFYYAGNGYVSLVNSFVDGNFTPGSVIARDGVVSEGLIEQTSNVYPGGTGYDLNGVQLINGTDFAVGVDMAATAANIATAINTSVDVAIFRKVYAIASGNDVILRSWKWNTAANAANTVALVGAAPANVTTFGGGTDGAGGTLNYFSSGFGNPATINTVTVTVGNTTVESF